MLKTPLFFCTKVMKKQIINCYFLGNCVGENGPPQTFHISLHFADRPHPPIPHDMTQYMDGPLLHQNCNDRVIGYDPSFFVYETEKQYGDIRILGRITLLTLFRPALAYPTTIFAYFCFFFRMCNGT